LNLKVAAMVPQRRLTASRNISASQTKKMNLALTALRSCLPGLSKRHLNWLYRQLIDLQTDLDIEIKNKSLCTADCKIEDRYTD
jgi:hypothetical protein